MSSGRTSGLQRAVLGLEPLLAAQRARQLDLRAQDREQARVFPRFLDEVARAAPHRLDGHLHAAPCRHDDDGQRSVVMANLREQIQPLLSRRGVSRVVQIHQHGVEFVAHRWHRGSPAGEPAESIR